MLPVLVVICYNSGWFVWSVCTKLACQLLYANIALYMYICTATSEETAVKSIGVNASGIGYYVGINGVSKVLKSKISLDWA